MGFFSNIVSATVKTALTPIAVVKDVVNVATDQKADATKKHVDGITKDVSNATKDIL